MTGVRVKPEVLSACRRGALALPFSHAPCHAVPTVPKSFDQRTKRLRAHPQRRRVCRGLVARTRSWDSRPAPGGCTQPGNRESPTGRSPRSRRRCLRSRSSSALRSGLCGGMEGCPSCARRKRPKSGAGGPAFLLVDHPTARHPRRHCARECGSFAEASPRQDVPRAAFHFQA